MNMATEQHCSVCFEEFDTLVYGKCHHFLCLSCCWILRDIMKDSKCPICRIILPWVVIESVPFSYYKSEEEVVEMMRKPPSVAFFVLKEINLYGTQKHIDLANSVRSPQCTKCNISFDTIHSMSMHLKKVHYLGFCFICINSLNKLPKDYDLYDLSKISHHRKQHPICKLCDTVVLNETTLKSHRRTKHFSCEVCERLKEVSVFNTRMELIEHFRNFHFLCEIGECGRILLMVFSNKMDYHNHIIESHASTLSKEERKRLLNFTLEDCKNFSGTSTQNENTTIDISLSDMNLVDGNRSHSHRSIIDVVNEMRLAEVEGQNKHSLLLNDENFPHLNTSSRKIEANLPVINPSVRPNYSLAVDNLTYPSIGPSKTNDFPALPSNSTSDIKVSSISKRLVAPVLQRFKSNNVDIIGKSEVEEDFPSFPESSPIIFPNVSSVRRKTHRKPILYSPTTSNRHTIIPDNTLAAELGIKNLHVTVDPINKTKKKKNKKKKCSSANYPTVHNSNAIKLDHGSMFTCDNKQQEISNNHINNTKYNGNKISLLDLAKKACKDSDMLLAKFMQICALFMRGDISTTEFREEAISIIGDVEFDRILPMLADEIPDPAKGRALRNLLKKSKDNDLKSSYDSSSGPSRKKN